MSDVKIGRLAMRQEGVNWVAYYAMPDTMHGAIYLGSILMSIVSRPKRKEEFMSLMRNVVADLIEERTGVRPTWPDGPQPAPEHERAGHS
jgi:hypothetical protein